MTKPNEEFGFYLTNDFRFPGDKFWLGLTRSEETCSNPNFDETSHIECHWEASNTWQETEPSYQDICSRSFNLYDDTCGDKFYCLCQKSLSANENANLLVPSSKGTESVAPGNSLSY